MGTPPRLGTDYSWRSLPSYRKRQSQWYSLSRSLKQAYGVETIFELPSRVLLQLLRKRLTVATRPLKRQEKPQLSQPKLF